MTTETIALLISLVTSITALVKIYRRINDSNIIFKNVIYQSISNIVEDAIKYNSTTHDDVERANVLYDYYKILGGDGGCDHLIKKLEAFDVCR